MMKNQDSAQMGQSHALGQDIMRVLDFRGVKLSNTELSRSIPRAKLELQDAAALVQPLVTSVRDRGEAALREQAERFDGVAGHALKVDAQTVQRSLADCPQDVRQAILLASSRLAKGSRAQVPPPARTEISPGAVIEQRWQPVHRVGVYAPGGKAAYPSSVVMNVVAARTAGVEQIALASPATPQNGGLPHRCVLWAAALLEVDEVYAVGGAGAVAAFAYGVPEIGLEAVDVISGPGNVFVAAAKRQVAGIVGIDAEAGTTEILIIADGTADARTVAADLLSQAEHDEAAASILVTDSQELVASVQQALADTVPKTLNGERAMKALSGPQSALILVDSMSEAVRVSNAHAPEHLEIQTSRDRDILNEICNAGAIFLGRATPVSLGDYLAGSNHVLPTAGTARFQSGLGAYTFLRPQQVVSYTQQALTSLQTPLLAFANIEGLPAHGEAVTARQLES